MGIDLCISEGVFYSLELPKWDCGWYWGFGYIGNSRLHTHFDIEFLENNGIDKFLASESGLTVHERYLILDLFSSFYKFKEIAQIYYLGNSHISAKPALNLKDEVQYENINRVIIPKIMDEIINIISPSLKYKTKIPEITRRYDGFTTDSISPSN